jgi:hypothetical protein
LLARRPEQVTKAAETQQKLHGALRVIGVEWFITGFGRLSALNPTVSSAERERLDRARVLSESIDGRGAARRPRRGRGGPARSGRVHRVSAEGC